MFAGRLFEAAALEIIYYFYYFSWYQLEGEGSTRDQRGSRKNLRCSSKASPVPHIFWTFKTLSKKIRILWRKFTRKTFEFRIRYYVGTSWRNVKRFRIGLSVAIKLRNAKNVCLHFNALQNVHCLAIINQ